MQEKRRYAGRVKAVDYDVATAAEIWKSPIIAHMFGAKLYVSRLRPQGCLEVKDICSRDEQYGKVLEAVAGRMYGVQGNEMSGGET